MKKIYVSFLLGLIIQSGLAQSSGAIIETARQLAAQEHAPESNKPTQQQRNKQYDFCKIVGEDPAFLAILGNLGQISATDASVLIEGEGGTGK